MKRAAILFCMLSFSLFCSQASAVVKPCEYCHTGHMGKMALLNADLDQLCSGCHADRLKAGEHQTGITPPMVVKDLPLYGGKMACPTCHDPHAGTAGMLRKPAAELCLSCHDK